MLLAAIALLVSPNTFEHSITGVPASVEIQGDDPTDGGLTILLQGRLIRGGAHVTLNVDGDKMMSIVISVHRGGRLEVRFKWGNEQIDTKIYHCQHRNYAGVDSCSKMIFDGADRAASLVGDRL